MSERGNILVVDDDDEMRKTVSAVLKYEGFSVIGARDGEGMYSALSTNDIELIVLDLTLGKDNGLNLTRDLRTHSKIPIVMLTGKDEVIDKVVGLELGADDYITKPFSNRELVARIGSVIRRCQGTETSVPDSSGEIAGFDGWELGLVSANLKDSNGNTVLLTTYEYQVLLVFVRHHKRVLSRSWIMDMVADRDWNPVDRSLDVVIGKIRKKLNDDPRNPSYIRTVRNIGYIFIADVTISK